MPGSLLRQKKSWAPLFVSASLLCLGQLLRLYAHRNEMLVLNMSPYLKVHLFTGVGNLISALGLFCWITAVLILLHCLTRKTVNAVR